MVSTNPSLKAILALSLGFAFFSLPLSLDAQTKAPAAKTVQKSYNIGSVLGKDFASFAKVLGVKVSPKINPVPDFEPGMTYSQEEADALPKVDGYRWDGKTKDLPKITLFRKDREEFVTFFAVTFPMNKKIDAKGAMDYFKIPLKGLEIEEGDTRGEFLIDNIMIGKNRWVANFRERNDEGEDQPQFKMIWMEWIP